MNVHHVALTQCETVGFHGSRCVEVVLGGGLQLSMLELSNMIADTIVENSLHKPIVVIDSRVVEIGKDTEAETASLVGVLRAQGFTVIGLINGNAYPLWVSMLSYVVAWITDDKWLGYQAHELQYQPAKGSKLSEPYIGPVNYGATKALVLDHQRNMADMVDYYAGAKFDWSVLSGQRIVYTVVLAKENK